jgi:ammonia channel protein AmtB
MQCGFTSLLYPGNTLEKYLSKMMYLLMSKITVIIFIFITVSCNIGKVKNIAIQEPEIVITTELSIENKVGDFGEINRDTTLVASFRIKNTGKSELKIKEY